MTEESRPKPMAHGLVCSSRANVLRGFRSLVVWQDSVAYYRDTFHALSSQPAVLLRVVSNQLASVDSVHRNIAEGYGRRSIREYLNHLNIAKGSLTESISGLHALRNADHIGPDVFESLDALSFKIENGLIRLVDTIRQKGGEGTWNEDTMLRESNEAYGSDTSDQASFDP